MFTNKELKLIKRLAYRALQDGELFDEAVANEVATSSDTVPTVDKKMSMLREKLELEVLFPAADDIE